MKHLAKTVQGSRFGVLLDSSVTIGCNAKGRSSSTTLNYYLSTSLPYVLGGSLCPYLFHVRTDDNCADDPSRLVPLRRSLTAAPFWLKTFLSGNLTKIVASRRESLYKDFVSWGSSELQCNFQQVTGSGLLLGTALVAYGKALFYGGSPKYVFSETLNAVCDHFKHFKPFLAVGWSILTRWEEEEPVKVNGHA